jgi:hypothetical protein
MEKTVNEILNQIDDLLLEIGASKRYVIDDEREGDYIAVISRDVRKY